MQSALPLHVGAAEDLKHFPQTIPGKIVLAIAASAFVALCAHVSVPLYFTPVPLTLQTFAVILIGLALGPVLGASAMVLYLAEGAIGLPVFSPHGLGGVAQLLGPTGGFLFSYPLAAASAGIVSRTLRIGQSKFPAALLGGVAASFFIFAMGAEWIAHFKHVGAAAVWYLAIAPFLPGEVVKVSAAAGIFSALQRWHRS
jgi:biotin transport system substrate-specific component